MWFSILPASQEILDFSSLPSKAGPSGVAVNRKIAIENLAILQTGDLPAILRCRRIFALHRILPLSPCGDRFQICPQKRGIKGEGFIKGDKGGGLHRKNALRLV